MSKLSFTSSKLLCCRPAPRPDQEQQHEEAGGQDADGDFAWRADQQGARQAGGAGRQPGLCHAHWPRVFLLPIDTLSNVTLYSCKKDNK